MLLLRQLRMLLLLASPPQQLEHAQGAGQLRCLHVVLPELERVKPRCDPGHPRRA